ncbi:adhesion G protein-coupled receptor E2-like [Physella acuta]|uniref:adhesion G protein-coupled receptor E2-like n=1 Tax=Physella acuta TaxID=109671 RepID=UPI0027DAD5B8|nr:adhesion G protein-coupled receptor E2-like [Physella acuta]
MLDNNERTCIACSGETWGPQCSHSCSCTTGSTYCDIKIGCVCKPGYTGQFCETDIDECKTSLKKCGFNEFCQNLPGSATCECIKGFYRQWSTCNDIDECSALSPCDKNLEYCTNTIGSYRCSCNTGYIKNSQGICTDIDECALSATLCDKSTEMCVNKIGSYTCACKKGYARKFGRCEE